MDLKMGGFELSLTQHQIIRLGSIILKLISENENLRVLVRKTAATAVIVGGSAAAGALLLGGRGLLIGSSIGTAVALKMGMANYKSVNVVYDEVFTPEVKLALASALVGLIEAFLGKQLPPLVGELPVLLVSNPALVKSAVEKVKTFFKEKNFCVETVQGQQC